MSAMSVTLAELTFRSSFYGSSAVLAKYMYCILQFHLGNGLAVDKVLNQLVAE